MRGWKLTQMFKPVSYLFIFLALSAMMVLPASQVHAWGVYMGSPFGWRATVDENATGTHTGGLSISRTEVLGNNGLWQSNTYGYIKYMTPFDFDHNHLPWAGGGENLDTALVYLKGNLSIGTTPLKVEIYHVTDDNWNWETITYANSPMMNGATATLLDTQTIAGSSVITWDLLASGAYLNIWNTQDKLDHEITLMFKLSPGELGGAILTQESISIALEGTGNPVPVPAAVWLMGSGFLGLCGLRRKIAK